MKIIPLGVWSTPTFGATYSFSLVIFTMRIPVVLSSAKGKIVWVFSRFSHAQFLGTHDEFFSEFKNFDSVVHGEFHLRIRKKWSLLVLSIQRVSIQFWLPLVSNSRKIWNFMLKLNGKLHVNNNKKFKFKWCRS